MHEAFFPKEQLFIARESEASTADAASETPVDALRLICQPIRALQGH
jgi:hypothetical protein